MKYALTYYDHSESLWQEGEMRELLKLWKESFAKFGWVPLVLTRDDVRSHPRFDFFFEHFHAKPTTYPRTFTDACWLRWLASAHFGEQNNENVALFDMDVINYGFEPRDPEPGKMEILCSEPPASIFLGAILGSPQHFLDVCELFAAWKPDHNDWIARNGQLHQDDLSLMARWFHPLPEDTTARPKPEWLIKSPGCALYDYPNYRTEKLVHYGSGAMIQNKCWPKYKYIKKIRPF